MGPRSSPASPNDVVISAKSTIGRANAKSKGTATPKAMARTGESKKPKPAASGVAEKKAKSKHPTKQLGSKRKGKGRDVSEDDEEDYDHVEINDEQSEEGEAEQTCNTRRSGNIFADAGNYNRALEAVPTTQSSQWPTPDLNSATPFEQAMIIRSNIMMDKLDEIWKMVLTQGGRRQSHAGPTKSQEGGGLKKSSKAAFNKESSEHVDKVVLKHWNDWLSAAFVDLTRQHALDVLQVGNANARVAVVQMTSEANGEDGQEADGNTQAGSGVVEHPFTDEVQQMEDIDNGTDVVITKFFNRCCKQYCEDLSAKPGLNSVVGTGAPVTGRGTKRKAAVTARDGISKIAKADIAATAGPRSRSTGKTDPYYAKFDHNDQEEEEEDIDDDEDLQSSDNVHEDE
ncbi:hypothetical protein KVT40_002875 [Elsinoe batatas]|uniref:Uncharacterized protein n=1 Tax=Elsinoe batatas TaxID=2601811 RepID=A0A8K0PEA8_9PEZI|nr:hypothetical protein KVT40_002875 [Elsinoe batatas]